MKPFVIINERRFFLSVFNIFCYTNRVSKGDKHEENN